MVSPKADLSKFYTVGFISTSMVAKTSALLDILHFFHVVVSLVASGLY
jgi:hypothetical protein